MTLEEYIHQLQLIITDNPQAKDLTVISYAGSGMLLPVEEYPILGTYNEALEMFEDTEKYDPEITNAILV